MRVLVTGATGFLGRHLVERLCKEIPARDICCVYRTAFRCDVRNKYHWRPCELTDGDKVAKMLRVEIAPDVIFHLAANPSVKENHLFPTVVIEDNVVATHNLLAYCKPGTRFIFASSATVYGGLSGQFPTENSPLAPNSVYGATKVASEALVDAYTRLGKVSGLSLRLVANVGPGATHGVVKDILEKLASPARELELLGDAPGSIKPYLYVSDTADAFIRLGLSRPEVGSVNVSNTDSINIQEVAEVIMDATGIHKPIHWGGEASNWPGDNRTVRINTYKATEMGWQPYYGCSPLAVSRAASLWSRE